MFKITVDYLDHDPRTENQYFTIRDHMILGMIRKPAGTTRVSPSDPLVKEFDASELVEFRMYDDDDKTLYYEGKMRKVDLDDGDYAFSALDYFGVGSGCVDFRYKVGATWRSL
jgi:hypothetical protein